MGKDALRLLVEAGVDTFVCLQESYRECESLACRLLWFRFSRGKVAGRVAARSLS